MLPCLKVRADVPEAMDDPRSDVKRLERTLQQFGFINVALSRFRFLLKKYIIAAMLEQPTRQYHAIDLGAGACETDVWLLKQARRRGLKLEIIAYDHDRRVIEYAQRLYGDVPGLSIVQEDISEIESVDEVDFIYANHLLHHLDDTACRSLIGMLSGLAGVRILISDIDRNLFAYCTYAILAAAFTRESFALHDGLISIKKGFKRTELEELVKKTFVGGDKWKVEQLFPSRLVMLKWG